LSRPHSTWSVRSGSGVPNLDFQLAYRIQLRTAQPAALGLRGVGHTGSDRRPARDRMRRVTEPAARRCSSTLRRASFARLRPRSGEVLGCVSVDVGLLSGGHDVGIWTGNHERLVAIIGPSHPIGRFTVGGVHREDLCPPCMVADVAALDHEPIAGLRAHRCLLRPDGPSPTRCGCGMRARRPVDVGERAIPGGGEGPDPWRRPRQQDTGCLPH